MRFFRGAFVVVIILSFRIIRVTYAAIGVLRAKVRIDLVPAKEEINTGTDHKQPDRCCDASYQRRVASP